MVFRTSLLLATAWVTLAFPAAAQQAPTPPAPPPLPDVSLPAVPPLPPLPTPPGMEAAKIPPAVPGIPAPMAPTPPTVAAPSAPPLPALPKLKTIGEIPPAKPVNTSSANSGGWLDKIKSMVGMGEEKKLPPAVKKETVRAVPAPIPPKAPDAIALPPAPKLDDLRQPPTAEIAKPEAPTPPALPTIPAPEKIAVPALPTIPTPPAMPALKLPDVPAQKTEIAPPPLPKAEAPALPKLEEKPKDQAAMPPLPELSLPPIDGSGAPALPKLPEAAQKPEPKVMPNPVKKEIAEKPAQEEESPLDENAAPDASVDPGVFEFGALNDNGKPPAKPKGVPTTTASTLIEADVNMRGFPDHDFRTQVLPTIINRKDYETRNAHLPKAVYKEDLESLLFIATGNGDLNAMRALLNQGVNVEAKNSIGDTPLVHAAINGQAGAVRVLLARGADANNPNVHGLTAMQVAAQRGREDIIEALFEMGAKSTADYRNPLTPLKSGVGRGYASIYNAMLDGENPRLKEQEQRNRALSALAEAGPAPRLVLSAGPGQSKEIRDPRLQKAPGTPLTFDEIEKGLMYQEYKRKTGDDPAARSMTNTTIPKTISPAGTAASPVPIPYPAKQPMMAVPQQPREGMQLPPQPYGRMVPRSDMPAMGAGGGMENPTMVAPGTASQSMLPPQPMPDAPMGKGGLPDDTGPGDGR